MQNECEGKRDISPYRIANTNPDFMKLKTVDDINLLIAASDSVSSELVDRYCRM